MHGHYDKSYNKSSSIIDYLVENYYIDTSAMIKEYEDITSFEYCGNNNDNGCNNSSNVSTISSKINRRQIIICTK
jgi:hypothetical protein